MADASPPNQPNDLEALNKVISLNILTQDEQQMVHIVKRHFYENGLIYQQLTQNLATIIRNIQNVQILCQGDAAFEQELTVKLNEANSTLKQIRDRLAPKDQLVIKLKQLQKDCEKVTSQQQTEEMLLHRVQNKADTYQAELQKKQAELDKLNESMKFKEEIHKHLKKNLLSRKSMITRLKTTMDELTAKLNKDSQDLKLEQQRKQQQIDRLQFNAGRLRQQLSEAKQRLDTEKGKYDSTIADWRERTRQAMQRRNDVFETLQKGDMETKLLQSQMQRHVEKHAFIQKRSEEESQKLYSVKKEIEEHRATIAKNAAIPETYLNTVKQLQSENAKLKGEIEQITKDEKEAREQATKLKAEYAELESMDAKARRQKMENQLKSLRDSLEKIDGAVKAAESSYTCFECLKPVKSPMTFVPCGHSICRHHNKHTDDVLICPECKAQCDTVFANNNVPELLSKLQFLHSLISTALEN